LILGDLVFFSNQSRIKVTHVGIYLGNNYFVHASESYGVTISGLTGTVYRSSFFGAGRIMKWENDFSDTTQNSSN
jgi:cell wall-associated NlpC family hydrolase